MWKKQVMLSGLAFLFQCTALFKCARDGKASRRNGHPPSPYFKCRGRVDSGVKNKPKKKATSAQRYLVPHSTWTAAWINFNKAGFVFCFSKLSHSTKPLLQHFWEKYQTQYQSGVSCVMLCSSGLIKRYSVYQRRKGACFESVSSLFWKYALLFCIQTYIVTDILCRWSTSVTVALDRMFVFFEQRRRAIYVSRLGTPLKANMLEKLTYAPEVTCHRLDVHTMYLHSLRRDLPRHWTPILFLFFRLLKWRAATAAIAKTRTWRPHAPPPLIWNSIHSIQPKCATPV